MKEQLIQYVNLLFAGVPDCEDMKQEILQNTLDRYDDLVSQGKVPEAAYRLAISGIGDVNELLGNSIPASVPKATANHQPSQPDTQEDANRKKLRAGGIALYILSAIPLIVLSDLGYETFGLVLTLIMVAAATFNMIVTARKDGSTKADKEKCDFPDRKDSPNHQLKKSIHSIVDAITLAVYLIVSFTTGAWYITWLIFPICGCINGLVSAIIDLKEAKKHEN